MCIYIYIYKQETRVKASVSTLKYFDNFWV